MTRAGLLLTGLLLLLSCSSKASVSPASTPKPVAEEVGKGEVKIGSTSDPNRSLAAEPAPDCQRLDCEGSLPQAGVDALRSRALLTRRCYEMALRKNPKLLGRVTVALRLDRMGQPCRASIVQTELGKNPELYACLLEVMNQPMEPLPSGCVDVHVPLSFVPSKEETQTDAGVGAEESNPPEPGSAD
jgi:hypothetical protein